MTSMRSGYGGFGVRPRAPGNARVTIPEARESNQRMIAAAEAALSQPFVGLTTDGRVAPDLFSLRSDGASTADIKDAAEAFLAALTDEQREGVRFEVGAREWRQWANHARPTLRHGLLFENLSEGQRAAAPEIVRRSLSNHGFDTVRGVMKLNEALAEITDNTAELGEWIYFFSVFGTPSAQEPWGWQIDGHHLIVNCFILGSQMVLTPTFVGAEPATADRGKYAGTAVLQDEQQHGLDLVRALSPEQCGRAILYPSVLPRDLPPGRAVGGDGRLQAGAYNDNLVLPYEGVRADGFSRSQEEALLELVKTYVGYTRPDLVEDKMAEVRRHLADTYFAWIGGYGDEDVFYYKVHSPVVLIEFDHQSGVFLDDDDPQKFHMHSVVRTPNGNDYGRDLLRQHYERFHQPGPGGSTHG